MTTMQIDRAVVEQALEALEYAQQDRECPSTTRQAIAALRAALAQQVEPQGCATEEDCTKQPWCRIRGECQRKQAEPLNLSDRAVQRRLAAQWGYVPAAAQAEPVEPVAWIESPHGAIRANPNYKFTFPSQLLHWQIPLYIAPPQRKPLTKEEILRAFYAAENPPMSIRHGLSVVESARIVERAHGIKE